MNYPFPTSAQHHIGKAPPSLQFLPWEKENPGWTSSLPSTAGYFLGDPLKYHITGITKESEELRREAKLTISSTQIFSSVQSLSHVRLFTTPWTAACQASLSITVSRSLLKFMSVESVMLSNHLILFCPLLLLPWIFPRIGGLVQWIGSSNQMPKVLEFQLQHQSFQWIFRVDFLYDWRIWFPCCPRNSQESSTTVQKYQFFMHKVSLKAKRKETHAQGATVHWNRKCSRDTTMVSEVQIEVTGKHS